MARKSNLPIDSHGRIIRRDIRYPVPPHPQGETISLWLDRVHPVYPWGFHPGFERTRRTECYEYRGLQEVVSCTWFPLLGIGRHCILYCFGGVGGTEIWAQVHVAIHWGLQFDWRSQR